MIHIVSQELVGHPGRGSSQVPQGKVENIGSKLVTKVGGAEYHSLSAPRIVQSPNLQHAIRCKMDDSNEVAEHGNLDIRDWKKSIREYLKLQSIEITLL